MNRKKQQKSQDVTFEALEGQLCNLPEVEVPDGLQTKLLAAIADSNTDLCRGSRTKSRHRAWIGALTAAAAVLILALIPMANYTLPAPSRTSFTEFDDSLVCGGWLHGNNFLYDQNNTFVEKSLPPDFRWPVVHQNEP